MIRPSASTVKGAVCYHPRVMATLPHVIRRVIPVALIALAATGCRSAGDPPQGNAEPDFAALFEPLGPPQPGDWLYVRPETSRPFEEYKRSGPNRAAGDRNTLVVAPLGKLADSEPELLQGLKAYLEAFFDRPVRIAKPRPIPTSAHVASRRQNDAGVVLDDLCAVLPEDAAAMLGILELDLFHKDLNFVFGLGSLVRRTGICSIARYRFRYMRQPEEVTLFKRTCKVAAHEICHMLGMQHCTRYRCAMNGSNSIVEADNRPLFLCPECLRKLEWNLGFDRCERYERLLAFYRAHPEFTKQADRARQLLRASR